MTSQPTDDQAREQIAYADDMIRLAAACRDHGDYRTAAVALRRAAQHLDNADRILTPAEVPGE